MKDYRVINRFTGHALGLVRAKSKYLAEILARAAFGCYAGVESCGE